MGEKLRSVNTKFWDDPFIEKLPPDEKLLFLYLLTNSLTSILGIYEITIKRICYDTGLSNETVSKGLKGFERVRKVFYVFDNYIILPNWLKNQRLNSNMKIGVINEFNTLPIELKNNISGNSSEPFGKDYETLRNTLLKYKEEVEVEVEIEVEVEVEVKAPTPKQEDSLNRSDNGFITSNLFDRFWDLYPRRDGKGKSLTIWNRICNRKDKQPTWLQIKHAIRAQIETPRWKEDKKYIPMPATWLNESRWLDDPEVMVSFPKDADQKPLNTIGSRSTGKEIIYTKEIGKC